MFDCKCTECGWLGEAEDAKVFEESYQIGAHVEYERFYVCPLCRGTLEYGCFDEEDDDESEGQGDLDSQASQGFRLGA